MVTAGKWLFILGAGSFLLHFIGFEFRLLMWIDAWGTVTGNMIRIGMLVAGAVLFGLGMKRSKPESAEAFEDVRTRDEVPAA